MDLKFRKLKANEIECRVAAINQKGLSLLLYKDARCDMRILDEVVGACNWKREHTRDNANCTVSIWDDDKKQWISKEDTGTESYTEKEKGIASDSFKRACFNWGIGRELYTAPFIWIKAKDVNIEKREDKFATKDSFSVLEIAYDNNEMISKLVILNNKLKKVVFTYSKIEDELMGEQISSTVMAQQREEEKNSRITAAMLNTIKADMERLNIKLEKILDRYNVTTLAELTVMQYKSLMNDFERTRKARAANGV